MFWAAGSVYFHGLGRDREEGKKEEIRTEVCLMLLQDGEALIFSVLGIPLIQKPKHPLLGLYQKVL